MTVINELYESLKGNSRLYMGELYIDDFEDEDYETLFKYIVDALSPYIKGNYEYFYSKWARSYYRKFQRDRRTVTPYCPQFEKDVYAQTVREQLVILKYFIMIRNFSRYSTNVEERK